MSAGDGHQGSDGDAATAGGPQVVIVEDHAELQKGMEHLLREQGFPVVGVAADARSGRRMIERRRPDVSVIDADLPGHTGVELTQALLKRSPRAGVLLYTGLGAQTVLSEALDSGARGIALKSGAPEQLTAAIRCVAAGGTYVDPRLAQIVIESATARLGLLSKREREVLDLLADGLTGEEAAKRLHLSPETVRTHIRNAIGKLEAKTRAHAVTLAFKRKKIAL